MSEGFAMRQAGGLCLVEPVRICATGLVRAGFTTRAGGVSPAPRDSLDLGLRADADAALAAENFGRLYAAADLCGTPAILSQVHGDVLVEVDANTPPPGIRIRRETEADGMIVRASGRVLITHHADCVPVFLLAEDIRAAALVHSGWRGTAARIAYKAARRLADMGADPERMLAAVGPCICSKCFETDGDVPEAMLAALGEDARPHMYRRGDKWHVDLPALCTLMLTQAGLSAQNVAGTQLCTCCRDDLFFSHRRMGARRGTMAAYLELID